jgi:carbon-monoxide dehydrogenase large subunit
LAHANGVGASVLRKEDDRFLRGKGHFIGDISLDRTREIAFVRSPVAHAKFLGIQVPDALRSSVFTAKDLTGVKPIRAVSPLPGFKPSEQHPLVTDKIRHVGELIAMCVADTRAEAEDIVNQITVDYEALPAVVDMLDAQLPDAPRVHEEWDDNIYLEVGFDGDVETAAQGAPVSVTRQLRTARQVMSPIEGRGFIAHWDARLEQLVVHGASQFPHVVRTGLAGALQIPEIQVRVISTDIGGGFGYKAIVTGEEICLCWLAMRCGHPVRWLEDRREQLTANANCREHYYDMTAYADETGKILAFDAKAAVDSGAYSAYPFTAAIEPSQVSAILPGPYDLPAYRCSTVGVATNKTPQLPYRGVARPGCCYAMELMIDAIAREVGKEPYEVRLANLVGPEQMPFDNVTDKHFDSGDYPELLRKAVAAIDVEAIRDRQKKGEADGRLIGLGFSIFSEQTAHGATADGKRRVMHEQAFARLTPDGRLDIRVGIQSIGQGLETTLAQVAVERLGIDISHIFVRLGDTEQSPYSSGAWGSRGMVWAGGAVARACEEIARRVASIGAALLQTDIASVEVRDGGVYGPDGSVSIADIARSYYLSPSDLPGDTDSRGLETTEGYAPDCLTGLHTGSAHAAVVAIDPETGGVDILDYVIAEDAGVLINPMIVDGQLRGGAAQGIGTALFEEMPYDDQGQPMASTLAEYLLPGTTDVPNIRLLHMETPSPYTNFGQKGVGEGGAIGPAGAIANAINDALAPLGVEINRIPVTPRRIIEAIGERNR